MCGIVGYVGTKEASSLLLEGLKRLEYRGYDSAGLAVFNGKKIEIRRAEGKLDRLQSIIESTPISGTIGIGHTRWATHGRPSALNAHPHRAGVITLVHNGIVENEAELREQLIQKGCHFESETDSEIIAQWLNHFISEQLTTERALRETLSKLHGSYALVFINEHEPELLYAVRSQSPLVIGLGEEQNFVASDVPALLSYTRKVIYLEDGDWAKISKDQVQIFDAGDRPVERPIRTIAWNLAQAEKEGHPHFMHKEIFEAPRAFSDTLRGRLGPGVKELFLEDFKQIEPFLNQIERINLVACGTSYHAALLGKSYFEDWAKIPVTVDFASEFRYRNAPLGPKVLLFVISQSGETADTLVCVKKAKQARSPVYAICNVVDSSIAREASAVFYTHAGPEIGVAATKTFLTQIEALILIALCWGRSNGNLTQQDFTSYATELLKLPGKLETVLAGYKDTKALALAWSKQRYFIFIGRGYQYPIALEGALKLKEISYIASEGYAAGELKHGPIAMIESKTPVIALVPEDSVYEKTKSNIQEVLARRAEVAAITSQRNTEIRKIVPFVLEVPETIPAFYPLLTVVPLQILAYEIAREKGQDVDQPRNLAKSVTVE